MAVLPLMGCGATPAPSCAAQRSLFPARIGGALQWSSWAVPCQRGLSSSWPRVGAPGARFACRTATMENEFAVMDDEAEDFYQLLGVVRRPALF